MAISWISSGTRGRLPGLASHYIAHLESYSLELIPFSEPDSLLLDLIGPCSSVTFEINVSFSND